MMVRALAGVAVAFVIAILAAHYAYLATAHGATKPVNPVWAQDSLQFVAWNGDHWTAWILDDDFVQLPKSDDRSRHKNRSIAFIDWQGEPWQAKIDGDEFLLAHRGDWQGAVERSAAIRCRDWSGDRQLRTVAQLRRQPASSGL